MIINVIAVENYQIKNYLHVKYVKKHFVAMIFILKKGCAMIVLQKRCPKIIRKKVSIS